uniref:Secreted protein n=1 Tax=Caenorhabditis tropicalis TaxID=1561998 RepID=A0A1I7TF75_9PELO
MWILLSSFILLLTTKCRKDDLILISEISIRYSGRFLLRLALFFVQISFFFVSVFQPKRRRTQLTQTYF